MLFKQYYKDQIPDYYDLRAPRIFVTCRKCNGKACYRCPICGATGQEEILQDEDLYPVLRKRIDGDKE